MKLNVGGYRGTPIPKIFNPLCFLFAALMCCLGVVVCLFVAALCVIYAPFSFLSTIRMTHE